MPTRADAIPGLPYNRVGENIHWHRASRSQMLYDSGAESGCGIGIFYWFFFDFPPINIRRVLKWAAGLGGELELNSRRRP